MREQSMNSRDRSKLRTEVEALVASDAPDAEVLEEVVRLVHEAHPQFVDDGFDLDGRGDQNIVLGLDEQEQRDDK